MSTAQPMERLSRVARGLAMLRGYQRQWLRYDIAAGLSVAAVALPTAIAYAQLAGFPPVVGLYASNLPLVVYAVLGTSRELIVNPDAATCAMVAAIVAPLAFAVTGADSRTAISDVMGGKTQVTGLVAAATMALVLVFLTGPLQYVPISGLGAVLLSAALGLFDWPALVRFFRIHEGEFLVCLAAMVGVVALGALQGIALAIALAMLVLLIRSSRPADSVLGRVAGQQGFVDLAEHEDAAPVPGLVLYRFNASLIFYNAPYFRRRVLAAAANSPGATWLIVDGAPLVHLDSTGADTIAALADELAALGIRLSIDGVWPQVHQMLDRSGALGRLGSDAVFPNLRTAVEACESSRPLPAFRERS